MDELIFKQPKWWKSAWELYRAERLVGSFKIIGWSWMRAEVHLGEQRYEVRYSGWMNRFSVHNSSGGQIAEAKQRSLWNSTMDIELAGKRYILSYNWNGRHAVTDDQERKVVEVKSHWWKCSATALINNPTNENELLLAILLFYHIQVISMSTVG